MPLGYFKTSDTPLAAYIVSLGFELFEIQYETSFDGKSRAIFVFENNSSILDDSVKAFRTLSAIGNVPAYENARRELLNKLKRGLSV